LPGKAGLFQFYSCIGYPITQGDYNERHSNFYAVRRAERLPPEPEDDWDDEDFDLDDYDEQGD